MAIIGLCAFVLVLTVCVANAPCKWQSFTWVLIKVIERSLWTFFAWVLADDFKEYSRKIQLDSAKLESILFIAVIPLILGVIMFILYSNIARMKIPFVNVENFTSNVMAKFDFREGLKVGLVSTGVYNSILYLAAAVALREERAAVVLFLFMVIVPGACACCVLCFLWFLLKEKKEVEPKRSLTPRKSSQELISPMVQREGKDEME